MKGKANGKRFIAFLLSVAMILSTWAVAFAEESSPAESSVETQDTEVRSIQDGEAASEAVSVQNTEENQTAPVAGEKQLACPLTVHQHTAECYNAEAALICGEADYAIHIHNDDCYDAEGKLVCPLSQVEAHEHTEACYEEQQTLVCGMAEEEGHIHDESCYTRIQGETICTDESSEHIHSDECYAWGQELTCGMEENPGHQHSEACYGTQQVLICGKEEIIPHTHTEDCRDENGALICGRLQAAEHVHGEECFKTAANEIALTRAEGARRVTLPDGNTAYPGEKQADGTWVAYDAEYSNTQPADATIKVTVTLPTSAVVPEGYKLFIRKVGASEPYYPSEQAVKDEVSEYNDFQCFRIRWVKVDENGKSDVKKMPEVLNGEERATIKIEYVGPDNEGKLKGLAGARKLLIYNSYENGTLKDTLADLVENVTVDGDSYTSFTFHTNGAGPYVFVSKKLEQCYVEALKIQSVEDGSEPFDSSDTAGNDSGPNNRIVRSYDTIQYNLEAKFGARDQEVTNPNVTMYFELTLSKSATSARFDTGKMVWLGENYSIEYLDSDGNVIMVEAHNGNIYEPQIDGEGNIVRDSNGFAQADMNKEVYINSKVNGSGAGELSYKVAAGTGIAKQRLVGWTELSAKEGQSILVGTQKFSAAIEVRNADNNERLLTKLNRYKMTSEEKAEYESLLNVSGNGIIGYIEIEKINCSLPVYHGTAESALQIAAGHIEGTSLPVGGASTHCVISGHRGLPRAKLFTNLDKLVEGDTFELHILNEILTYEVDQISVVEPDEVEKLEIEEGKDYCTLVTCTPYGINTHRLLVRGHRVANREKPEEETIVSETVQEETKAGFSIIPLVAVLIFIILVILLLIRICRRR